MKKVVLEALAERGVNLASLADLVLTLQKPYYPNLSLAECQTALERVLEKREVQHAVLTGLAIDLMAEQGLLPEPLQTLIVHDESLYGIDEVLAMAITNLYGTIGTTSFGYLDKTKLGIIRDIEDNRFQKVNTFLDDLAAALAAAAAAKIAHGHQGSRTPKKKGYLN